MTHLSREHEEHLSTPTLAKPWAIVCDFDGTAIMDDIADTLAMRYLGADKFADVNARFQQRAITFRQLLHELFEPIAATPAEMHAAAQELTHFRPGFVQLLAFAATHGIPFTLASGGLDLYIAPALELLPVELRQVPVVRANSATYRDGGLDLQFPYADAEHSCGTCGSCKRAIVMEWRNAGYSVLAIGDGNADRCMAGVADVLYARARLLEWCKNSGHDCVPFDTLEIVTGFLETQLLAARPR